MVTTIARLADRMKRRLVEQKIDPIVSFPGPKLAQYKVAVGMVLEDGILRQLLLINGEGM